MFDGQEDIRKKEFPHLMNRVWLNSAAFTPHSISVSKAMEEFIQLWHKAEVGEAFDKQMEETTTDTYSEAAKLLNCHTDDISLVINTAHGLNYPLLGIDWEKGDNVVTCDLEFPTNFLPWQNLSKKKDVELRSAKYDVNFHVKEDDIIALIDEKTRLVSLSLVQFNTGQRFDVKKIAKVARENNAQISLDAIQAIGGIEVYPKEMDVDFISAGGPKFLMGPLGLGICYINPKIVETMDPPMQGTGNYDFKEKEFDWNDRTVNYLKGAKRFQNGTIPVYCMPGLLAAMKMINSVGIKTISDHNLSITQLLISGIEELGFKTITPHDKNKRGALINVRLDKKIDLEKLVKKLEEKHKVTISARFGGLRISSQLFNTEDDVQKCLAALKEELAIS
ncbi:MAG: aminotransferase class V-fold PLP-dependent enzyme [Asgard group archaeon]|nr:aminotransferase class V-fold PLP-dependent enzyme [Asgard group archaeon]